MAKETSNEDSKNNLWLSVGPEAVDASLITKDHALVAYCEHEATTTERIGAIGNGVNDLPMLRAPGLAAVGAPANAQRRVLGAVRGMQAGWVSKQSRLDGFLEFYDLCHRRGIEHVVTDRDGVVHNPADPENNRRFGQALERIGTGGTPRLAILTGSSREDNLSFISDPFISRALTVNSQLSQSPSLLLMIENGAFSMNVLTGETEPFVEGIDAEFLRALKNEFEPVVVSRVRERLRRHLDLDVVFGQQSGTAGVALSKKKTMVTFVFSLGSEATPKVRWDLEEEIAIVLDSMLEVADEIGFSARLL